MPLMLCDCCCCCCHCFLAVRGRVEDDRVRLLEMLFQGYVNDMLPRCKGEIPEAQIDLSLRAILDVVCFPLFNVILLKTAKTWGDLIKEKDINAGRIRL